MKLFGFERVWAAAAFDTVFPEQSALPHGIARMNPGGFFANLIAVAPAEQALGLRLTLWIVALAPLWFLRRAGTIASVKPDDRQRTIERLLASPVYAIRQLVTGFKAVGAMLYSMSPEVRAAMTTPQVKLFDSGRLTIRRKSTPQQGGSREHAA
jgi:hypothetical protein